MNNLFLKKEFQHINSLNDLKIMSDKFNQLENNLDAFEAGINFYSYCLNALICGISGFILLPILLKAKDTETLSLFFYIISFISFALIGNGCLKLIKETLRKFSFYDTLTSKIFNKFKHFRQLTSDHNQINFQLEQSLSNTHLQYGLIDFLDDLDKKINNNENINGYKQITIQEAKKELVSYFIVENYCEAKDYITQGFTDWSNIKLEYQSTLQNNAQQTMTNITQSELIKNYCQENDLQYEEEVEHELGASPLINLKSIL